jgi:hypothetical protein
MLQSWKLDSQETTYDLYDSLKVLWGPLTKLPNLKTLYVGPDFRVFGDMEDDDSSLKVFQ